MLEVLYGAGVRISELVGLDRADLDLDAGSVRVLGKGAKERLVPVGRPARAATQAYLTSGRPALLGPRARPGDAVFLNARGGRLTRQGVWIACTPRGSGPAWANTCTRTFCAIRAPRTWSTTGPTSGWSRSLLGHASLATTQVYTQVSAARLRAVYDAAHPRARLPAGGSAGEVGKGEQ